MSKITSAKLKLEEQKVFMTYRLQNKI